MLLLATGNRLLSGSWLTNGNQIPSATFGIHYFEAKIIHSNSLENHVLVEWIIEQTSKASTIGPHSVAGHIEHPKLSTAFSMDVIPDPGVSASQP